MTLYPTSTDVKPKVECVKRRDTFTGRLPSEELGGSTWCVKSSVSRRSDEEIDSLAEATSFKKALEKL